MKKKITPRIAKAIDIFLDAINEGTLKAGTCQACAVTNLIAPVMGEKIERHLLGLSYDHPYALKSSKWNKAFNTGITQTTYPQNFECPEVLACVNATDFTMEELMKIEYAFETSSRAFRNSKCGYTERELQIAGLKAVVECMLTFDDCQEDVNEVFTKKAELIPLN